MIELNRIRTDRATVIASLEKRGLVNVATQVEVISTLDMERRATQSRLDDLSAMLNKLSKEIGEQLHKQVDAAVLHAKKQEISSLKEAFKQLSKELKEYESSLLEKLYQLPNHPHATVPVGESAAENEIFYETPMLPSIGQDNLAHWDLIKKYDLVDFELGNKVTGAGFPLYKGKGARLQRALINFFLDNALQAGYVEIQPPIVVNEASAYATGQLPDKEGQMYHIPGEGLYLIPTAEVPITNIYRDCIIPETSLPIKHAGYTPCFRREAGSWGAHVRGLNRLHQFDKVELVQICHPDHSYAQLEEMLAYVRGLIEQLELPYRVLKLCSGDLGFCAAMTYDIEVYSVAQDKWLEVSSISNFETFQSNRLSLRYKDKNRKSHLLHTLNGSALALPRILAALLELNQTTAAIRIPKVLQDYTKFDQIN
ncbi:serine--tRNA ligase [Cardinium endosymbiont of Tipula unca]|uniref:serine--tRNA ligase n=1 Tax=Cardinium endosymbiont of Tipula unca TaxID=3066216 RepID=UPI0030D0FAF2